MDVLCHYWIGEIYNSTDENMMNTIVIMTDIPIKKSDLKKKYCNLKIGLKKSTKKNDMKYTYIIFQHKDLSLFCQDELKNSCILKTILNIYNTKKNVEDEFRDKCCL